MYPSTPLQIGSNIADRLNELGSLVVAITQQLPTGAAYRHVAQQLVRAGTACGANYEEARGAESRADFIHKVSVAVKESRETVYWLKLIEREHASPEVSRALDEAMQLCAILTASVKTAKRNA